MKISPVKGTRDFYPEVKFNQDFIFKAWEKVSKKFGYENFDGPLLEPADLWRLKSGNEIPDQMYVFKDKGNREVAIRPELTPTLARMVAAKSKGIARPIKWYTIGRCWRYERAQAGRLREFWQLNVDCLGSESMQLDAEVIVTAIEIMRNFGLNEKDFYIRLGNRQLIESLILSTGVKKEQLKDVSRLIDKLDKIGEEKFKLSLKDLKMSDSSINKLWDMLKLKIEKIDDKSLDAKGKEGLSKIKELLKYIKFYGLEKYVEFDPSIMRGFDYYTSTVFEVFDRSKKFRAIAGGGRYDNLVKDFGGDEVSGVGYGMGDVVLELFLKEKNKLPEYSKNVDYFIGVMDEKALEFALQTATKLREENNVEVELIGRNLSKQMKYAKKIGAKKLIIIGDDEVKTKKVKVKDLEKGKEEVFVISQDKTNNKKAKTWKEKYL